MIHAGRGSTYADRRRAAAERLLLADGVTDRLAAAVGAPGPAGDGVPVDPDGSLRAAVRALVPLAQRDPAFDVMVSLGPDHGWAARLRRGADGLVADLVRGPGRPAGPPPAPTATEAEVAAELASLLWSGAVSAP